MTSARDQISSSTTPSMTGASSTRVARAWRRATSWEKSGAAKRSSASFRGNRIRALPRVPRAHPVDQSPDGLDGDSDLVAGREGEVAFWNDSRAGEKVASARERVVPEEEARELRRAPLHLRKPGLSLEGDPSPSPDPDRDLGRGRQGLLSHEEAGPESAASIVDLRLRKIKRILPLDAAGAHVVSDAVSKDLPAARDRERELRLGDVPVGIAPDPDLSFMAHDSLRRCFEEQLGSLRTVDSIVDGRFPLGLLHPGFAAAPIGHPRRPDLLAFESWEERSVGRARFLEGRQMRAQPLAGLALLEEVVEGEAFGIEIPFLRLDRDAVSPAVELHDREIYPMDRFGATPYNTPNWRRY